MLRKAQHRGTSALEYVVVAAIALAVLGVAIWSFVQAASGEGSTQAKICYNPYLPQECGDIYQTVPGMASPSFFSYHMPQVSYSTAIFCIRPLFGVDIKNLSNIRS